MSQYLNLVIIIGLLIGVGFLLLTSRTSNKKHTNGRWIGYALLGMTVMLVIVAILQHFDESAHNVGH